MSIETYCDLCDKKKECKKQKDGLWACIICRVKFYRKIKQSKAIL